jgi:hypothetical protein
MSIANKQSGVKCNANISLPEQTPTVGQQGHQRVFALTTPLDSWVRKWENLLFFVALNLGLFSLHITPSRHSIPPSQRTAALPHDKMASTGDEAPILIIGMDFGTT